MSHPLSVFTTKEISTKTLSEFIQNDKENLKQFIPLGETELPSSDVMREIIREKKLKDAINTPTKYINERLEQLINIKNQVNKVYIDTFNNLTSTKNKYPISIRDAKSMAMRKALVESEILMQKLELELPEDFSKKAINQQIINNKAERLKKSLFKF